MESVINGVGAGLPFVVGLAFIAAGVMLHRSNRAFRDARQEVSLKVVALHESYSRSRNSLPMKQWQPEFEIVSGAWKGTRSVSNVASRPAPHVVGDLCDGWYDPDKGIIRSNKTMGQAVIIAYACMAGGVLAMGVAGVIALG